MSEEAALEASLALVVPLGDKVGKHFRYFRYSNGQLAEAYSSRNTVADEKFGISKIEKRQ